MNWIKENWIKIAFVVIGFFIAFPIFYHYVIYIPQRDQSDRASKEWKEIMDRNEMEKAEMEKTNKLTICLATAEDLYNENWASNCKIEGKKEDCTSLMSWRAEALEKTRDRAKDDCFKQFK